MEHVVVVVVVVVDDGTEAVVSSRASKSFINVDISSSQHPVPSWANKVRNMDEVDEFSKDKSTLLLFLSFLVVVGRIIGSGDRRRAEGHRGSKSIVLFFYDFFQSRYVTIL